MSLARRGAVLAWVAAIALLPSPAAAHLGSPDVFLDGQAGPYRVFVTVRPPHAIPGVAAVEVLTTSDAVHEIRIVPLPLTGPGAQFAPVPDIASRSSADPRLFTGQLWMMTAGAWQVRVAVSGDLGSGQLAVPVPTLPRSTLAMRSIDCGISIRRRSPPAHSSSRCRTSRPGATSCSAISYTRPACRRPLLPHSRLMAAARR